MPSLTLPLAVRDGGDGVDGVGDAGHGGRGVDVDGDAAAAGAADAGADRGRIDGTSSEAASRTATVPVVAPARMVMLWPLEA